MYSILIEKQSLYIYADQLKTNLKKIQQCK